MVAQRVLPQHEGQLDLRHLCQQQFAPLRCAFGSRRQVTGFAAARIAESHRQNCDAPGSVEYIPADTHPVAQALPAGIVKRYARGMYPAAGRLSGD